MDLLGQVRLALESSDDMFLFVAQIVIQIAAVTVNSKHRDSAARIQRHTPTT